MTQEKLPMKNDRIFVPYNLTLEALEKSVATVKTPGSYFVHGIKTMPIPRMEINGVGTISFPIPQEQAVKIIQQAKLAPYGRGQETLLDVSVRNVWQVSPDDVKISGLAWSDCFKWILSKVKDGLGCKESFVRAELYKLLIYEKGGFFLNHRDTEKVAGMFGTLVISLPSPHKGGELVVRHAEYEVSIDLSAADTSEVAFAAFYADCEHEVKPVLDGYRICLVYNLIQENNIKQKSPLTAPLYTKETKTAACILKKHLLIDKGIKIAWLLEHQYSFAQLSFNTLKNRDAALAQVLSAAANQSGCTIHLGIVHIMEGGSAEPEWGYRSSRWYNDGPDDFEVIDVTDRSYYIDGWVDVENRHAEFGNIPIGEGELLPRGALDNEPPDEERFMASTGNEGASFERAYHRAALVIWHFTRYVEVLLQSGYQAAILYIKKQIEAGLSKNEVASLAKVVIDYWELHLQTPSPYRLKDSSNRCEMLKILAYLDGLYLEPFIANVIVQEFDGSETESLVGLLHFIDPLKAKELLSKLVSAKMTFVPNECIKLAVYLFETNVALAAHTASLVIASIHGRKPSTDISDGWLRPHRIKPIGTTFPAKLWSLLKKNKLSSLQSNLSSKMIDLTTVFHPEKCVIPILRDIYDQCGELIKKDEDFILLCQHSAQFLLKRSSHPPELPKDWSQELSLDCHCEDCQELQKFAQDPVAQVYRFRIRKDRRQHLHEIINEKNIDMTHETERTGSPQTLVCKKNHRSHELRFEQYRSDLTFMQELASWLSSSSLETHLQLEKALRIGEDFTGK